MTPPDSPQGRPPRTGTGDRHSSSMSGAENRQTFARRELQRAASNHWRLRRSSEWTPFSTGVEEIDQAIGGGFCRGEMVVIGARPSHGKTALVLQLLHGISREQPCLLFNSEMSEIMLGQRINTRIMGGMPESDWPDEQPEDWYRYWIGHRSCLAVEACRDVRKIVQLMRANVENDYGPRKPPRVVAIDYLQLLKGQGKGRYEQITDVSVQLRVATSELNCATVVCAQLSREVARPTKSGETLVRMPVMSDLRDSGQIEQDADVVLLLQWPWKENPEKPKHEFLISVAKNRNRAIVHPKIKIAFHAESQTFMSLRDWAYRFQTDEYSR